VVHLSPPEWPIIKSLPALPMNQDIPGKYIRKKTCSHYIELKADGNYLLFEGPAVVTGTYEVQGSDITIFGDESTSRGKIEDGVIVDSEGEKWIRPKDATATSDAPLAFMSWLPVVREDFPWELIDAGVILVIFALLGPDARDGLAGMSVDGLEQFGHFTKGFGSAHRRARSEDLTATATVLPPKCQPLPTAGGLAFLQTAVLKATTAAGYELGNDGEFVHGCGL
jgi:hypothetical protein